MMNIQIEFNTYKSLVMHLRDEDDNLDKVIERLLKEQEEIKVRSSLPAIQVGIGYSYLGVWHQSHNAISVFLSFLEDISQKSDNFHEKFANACRYVGSFRPYIASNKADLYPGRPDLQCFAKPLGDWWVDGNTSTKQKLELIHLAARTAGLQKNIDYSVRL